MIVIKVGEIIKNEEILKELMQEKLPAKSSYSLAKIYKKIIDEILLYNEQKNKKIVEFGEDQNNGNYLVKGEKFNEFLKEIKEIESIELNLEIEPISIEIFGDVDLKPYLLANLHWLLKD